MSVDASRRSAWAETVWRLSKEQFMRPSTDAEVKFAEVFRVRSGNLLHVEATLEHQKPRSLWSIHSSCR